MAVMLFSCTSKNKVTSNTKNILGPTNEFDLADSIPKITIQDISLTFPQLFVS